MKFSKLEQEEIKKICEWGKTSNVFWGISHYLSHYGLPDGTGIFSFPNNPLILCFDSEIFDQDKFYPDGGKAIKKTVFTLNFILKLERLNFVTLVPEKGVEFLHSFKGDGVSVYINNIKKNKFDYEFSYLSNKVNSTKAKLICEDNVIIDTRNDKQIYFCLPIYFEFDTYRLLSSYMTINQELFELVSNDFKTYEDIQLEEAKKQTESAQKSLKEAQRQTRWSIGAVCLSILTLIASIVMPIILSKCSTDPIENKMEKSQFDSIQSKQNELINTLYPLKTIQITNDSLIKELNLANESIDEISNTLKEIKELNSKRK